MKNFQNLGIAILRIILGGYMAIAGSGKIFSPEIWSDLGRSISVIGINSGFQFWGFMAAFSEFVGGILLVFGLFTPIAAFFVGATMMIAHKVSGEKHALDLMIVAWSFILIGGGKYSIDGYLMQQRSYNHPAPKKSVTPPAKKTPEKSSAKPKTTSTKKTTTKKAAPKKSATKSPTKKVSTTKKSTATKKAAPKKTTTKKTPTKKTTATKKASTTKKATTTRKPTAKKTTTKKATPKK